MNEQAGATTDAAFERSFVVRRPVCCRCLLFIRFGFFGPLHAFSGEADFAFIRIDSQDFYLYLLADLNDLLGVVDLMVGQFGDVQQTFESAFEAHEYAEVGDFGNGSGDDLPSRIPIGDFLGPRILGELFQSQGDSSSLLVDGEHATLDFLAFFDDLVGMADLADPGHVADVQQAVDAFLDFNKGTVVGEVPHGTLDDGAGGIAFDDLIPGVVLGLLYAEGDFLLFLVDTQHDHFDIVVDLHQFAGMADAPGPGHFADMHQAFDTLFQFDERSVAHHVYHGSVDAFFQGESFLDVFPRAGSFLFQAQGDLLFFVVDVQDLHFEFLVDGNHF